MSPTHISDDPRTLITVQHTGGYPGVYVSGKFYGMSRAALCLLDKQIQEVKSTYGVDAVALNVWHSSNAVQDLTAFNLLNTGLNFLPKIYRDVVVVAYPVGEVLRFN